MDSWVFVIEGTGVPGTAGTAFNIGPAVGLLPVVKQKGKKFFLVFAAGSVGIQDIGINIGGFIFGYK